MTDHSEHPATEAAGSAGAGRNTPDRVDAAGEMSRFTEADSGMSLLIDWLSIVAVVFLGSATLNSLMRWLSYGYPWDLGGTVLSGFLAFVCYKTTMSDPTRLRRPGRLAVTFLCPIGWAVLLPVVMMMLGFS